MNSILRTAFALVAAVFATQALAQVTFYEDEGFAGRSFTTARPVGDLERFGFNDLASSAVVGTGRWEVCEDVRFGGRCVVLRPGRYPSMAAMGLSDRVASVRGVARDARIEESRYAPLASAAAITFYENDGFGGRSFTTQEAVGNFQRFGFNDRASSVVVTGDRWEVCEDAQFSGRCMILRPGRYASLAAMGLNDRISSVRDVSGNAQVEDNRYAPPPAAAQVTFYEQEGFSGRSFATQQPVENFRRFGFNDRASSVVVSGERWEVCEDARYGGRCIILRAGRYPSLASMGLNNRISSVRDVNPSARIDDYRYAPLPAPVVNQDYRRRNDERVYEATVTSVKAVVGPPEERCWVERAEVAPERKASVPGAVVGALIGGILGHQVGSGKGKDIATAGGAVAGGVLGAKVGGGITGAPAAQDVKRCENVPSQAQPSFWDVTYSFRGIDHRVQMTAPPGPTISVNDRGEPRA